jgi:hypothetical protein
MEKVVEDDSAARGPPKAVKGLYDSKIASADRRDLARRGRPRIVRININNAAARNSKTDF